MSRIEEAVAALRSGKFVLVHDDKSRENELDMVIAAEFVGPESVAAMRTDAGGLLCLAISHEIAAKLSLPFLHDVIRDLGHHNPAFTKMTEGKAAYGDKPSFSIPINHRDTYTGITDSDRALTISKMADICKNIDGNGVERFSREFRSPGHVPLLIAAKRLLEERTGHTELCVYLMKLAGITPAVAICEMMDAKTHKALTVEEAEKYGKQAGIPMIEAGQLMAHAKVNINSKQKAI